MYTCPVAASRWILLASGLLFAITPLVQGQANPAQKKEAEALNGKAWNHYTKGEYDEAIRVGLQAEKLARQVFSGSDSLNTAVVQGNLGLFCWKGGRYPEAEKWHLSCLAIRKDLLAKDDMLMERARHNLGVLYEDWARFKDARDYYQQALDALQSRTRRARTKEDELKEAYYRQHLGAVLRSLGELQGENGAEKQFLKSQELREKRLGKTHPLVADCLNQLGLLYWSLGQFDQAEEHYKQCLQIREKVRDSEYAETLQNWAMLHRDRGELAKARAKFEEALGILQAKRDKQREANCLSNLGYLYQALNEPAKAEQYLRGSIEIFKALPGGRPLDVARVESNLGWLYHAQNNQNKLNRAEDLYQEGLEIRSKELGGEHPSVATSELNLALLRASQGQWQQALTRAERAQQIMFGYATRILPTQAEAQQLDFLIHDHQPALSEALSVGLEAGQDAVQSATWILNGKGLAQEILADRSLELRKQRDRERSKDLQKLQEIRSALAAQFYVKATNPKQSEKDRQDLRNEEADLTKVLIKSLKGHGKSQRVDVQEVRKALPADSILIELAQFGALDLHKAGGLGKPTSHYAAWIIPPQGRGNVEAIDLGEAQPIDAAVRAVRKALQDKEAIKKLGEKTSERQIHALLKTVSDQVLGPLSRHIESHKHWIVSADGLMWLVPWAALPLSNGHYAIEDHVISYVVSGRDLVRPLAGVSGSGALVLADPDYDAQLGEPAAQRTLELNLVPRVKRLPYTAAEAQGSKADLARYVGSPPEIRTQQNAREGYLKSLARAPKVLVLSTHGFFLQEPEQSRLPGGRGVAAAADQSSFPSDPLLRCGLILAGANNRNRTSGTEDGLLTGKEILQLDLRGTELVVLSACETGLGEVRNGEGVASLRQAFQLAGAQSVVSTLWEIPEQESTQLMVGFFGNLAKGQAKAEALRNSQLSLIENLKAEADAAHPFYWAAFTVTGF